MELWTDGTTHVVADQDGQRLRLLRGGVEVASREEYVPWKCALAVDAVDGRVHFRKGAYALADLEARGAPDPQDREWGDGGEIARAAAVGGGRLAAIVAGRKPARLVVGTVGDEGLAGAGWDAGWDLDFPKGRRVAGIVSGAPGHRAVGGDPNLWADAHRAVVADGQAGVVAVVDLLTGAAARVLHFGGRDETELFAQPWGDGLLVVSRFAARDAHVLFVPAKGTARRVLPPAYGACAQVVGPERAIVSSDRELLLVGPDGVVYDRQGTSGSVTASAGAPGLAAFATETRVVVARTDGTHLALETVVFDPRFDVQTEMAAPPAPDALPEFQKECTGYGRSVAPDGRWSLRLYGVRAERMDVVREKLRERGLTIAAVTPGRS